MHFNGVKAHIETTVNTENLSSYSGRNYFVGTSCFRRRTYDQNRTVCTFNPDLDIEYGDSYSDIGQFIRRCKYCFTKKLI